MSTPISSLLDELPGPNLPGTEIRLGSLVHDRDDALSRRDLVRLASNKLGCNIRVSGSAAKYEEREGFDVGYFIADALGGPDCSAAVFAGATMSIDRPEPGNCRSCDAYGMFCRRHGSNLVEPKQSVNDVLMHLYDMEAPAKTIGLVPIVQNPRLYGGYLAVKNDKSEPYYTVIDDRCPFCIVLQFSLDRPKLKWDDEWKVTLDYMELLRSDADQKSLHFFHGGGETVENEIRHVAQLHAPDNPWYILLIEDAGRVSQKLANDPEIRRPQGKELKHIVSCREAEAKTVVREMGFAPALTAA